jgi:hypothetical protein
MGTKDVTLSSTMNKLVLAAGLALLAFGATSPVTPLPGFSDPALSPDKSEIAFVSGGDIWTVPARGGEARLLISHPATEARPLYSPDGTKLAFTSTRTGNGDIYVLTFATGQLKRLTFSDAPESLDAWSRDGKWIYFSSNGNDIGGATVTAISMRLRSGHAPSAAIELISGSSKKTQGKVGPCGPPMAMPCFTRLIEPDRKTSSGNSSTRKNPQSRLAIFRMVACFGPPSVTMAAKLCSSADSEFGD